MTDCKPVASPGDTSQKLTKNLGPTSAQEREEMASVPYREAIGSLMFAMTCSRPDIAFEVGKVSQFAENPGKGHWIAVKRIMRYLKGTLDMKLTYGSGPTEDGPLTLPGFCDSDHEGNLDTRRSTAGVVLLLNSGPVAWMSRRQQTVALSTTEAEYMAISEAVKEVIWARQLLMDIGLAQEGPTTIFTDDQ